MSTIETRTEKGSVTELEIDAKTAKRAIWEALAFTIKRENQVRVTNESHADPDDHTYTVTVGETANGTLTALHCDCPAYQYGENEEACKHSVAVAARPVVMNAAAAYGRDPVRIDGGRGSVDFVTNNESDGSECVAEEDWCPGIPSDAETPDQVTTETLPCFDCWCYWSESE